MDASYIVLGLLVGILVGMTGVGGGSLVTPVLTFFGVAPAVAVGTDLLFAAITKSFGTVAHRFQASVDWRVMRLLAMGSCPAAALAVALLALTGAHEKSGLITGALSIALILTALVLLIDRDKIAGAALRFGKPLKQYRSGLTVTAGAVLGVLVTLSSVGAGALGATVLVLLYPRLKAVRIAGTDIAHAVPLTIIAGLGHAWLGTVNYALLGNLLVGSVPGIVAGSLLAGHLPENFVRRVLAFILMSVGLRLALVVH